MSALERRYLLIARAIFNDSDVATYKQPRREGWVGG